MTARERVARNRRRRRRGTELLCDRGTLADENAPARGVELHAVAHRARNHRGEARPARRGLDRIFRHHEHLFEAQAVDVACAPDVLRRELLYILDASLGHLLGRQPHDLELRRCAVYAALQIDERLRLEAVRLQPAMLALGVGRAVAHEVHAVVAPHELAHAICGWRVVRRREELDVALFEHHAAVRRAHGACRRLLHRDRRHFHAQRLEHLCRRVEVGDEMRNVIDEELARGRLLSIGDIHGALI